MPRSRWAILVGASALLLVGCSGGKSHDVDAAVDVGMPVDARRDAPEAGASADADLLDAAISVDVGGPPPVDAFVFRDLFGADAASVACGNGIREPGEQCDDGERDNLDSCDGHCRFEQLQRVDVLRLQFGTDAPCGTNAFGRAFALVVRDLIQQAWAEDIASGRLSFILQFVGLADPSGATEGQVDVGWLWGEPTVREAYDGSDDLDGWYAIDPASLREDRLPIAGIGGTISGDELRLGPGTIPLRLNAEGASDRPPSALPLEEASMVATLRVATAPAVSADGMSPGHLLGAQVDPTLVSFAGLGEPGLGAGTLCGKLSAVTLSRAPAPALLAGTGVCAEGYGADVSLLDVLVGGCTNSLAGPLVMATAPDTDIAAVSPAGAGPPYALALDAHARVATCLDGDGQSAPLEVCLEDAAYSVFFRFAASRVIGK